MVCNIVVTSDLLVQLRFCSERLKSKQYMWRLQAGTPGCLGFEIPDPVQLLHYVDKETDFFARHFPLLDVSSPIYKMRYVWIR